MDNQGLIDELKLLIKQGREEILTTKKVVEGVIGARPTVNNELYAGWYSKCITILGIVLGEDDRNFQKFISYEKHYFSNAQEAVKILESVLDYCGKAMVEDGPDEQKDLLEKWTAYKVARDEYLSADAYYFFAWGYAVGKEAGEKR